MLSKKDAFIKKLTEIYPNSFDDILNNIKTPKPTIFRVNTIKSSVEDATAELTKEGFVLESGPLSQSFIVRSGTKRISETKAFDEGRIYIQRLSSMLPVLELEPKACEKILDMCAAPGSKTSQIAEESGNLAQITAVENNRNRFFTLKNNLEKQGVKNFTLILEAAQFLDRNHPELIGSFDKILLDAPCSNEGFISLDDQATLERWNPKLPGKLSKLQKKLVSTGIKLLKPGGTLVYSTCTFSKEENEEVIEWVLKKFPEMKLEKLKRVTPDRLYSGFFFAKLLKSA